MLIKAKVFILETLHLIMDKKKIVKKIEGIQTIDSIMSILNINRQRAIYVIFKLRRGGYVRTQRMPDKKRVYHISFENVTSGKSYTEIINKYSPIKIATSETYKIYGRDITLEETLIFAVKSKKFRSILAALSLFRKICDWSLLYALAKDNKMQRQIGALYDLSKKIMRTRRMDGRFRRHMLPSKEDEYQYIIPGLRSKHFQGIERRWKVYLPFNEDDLSGYMRLNRTERDA